MTVRSSKVRTDVCSTVSPENNGGGDDFGSILQKSTNRPVNKEMQPQTSVAAKEKLFQQQ